MGPKETQQMYIRTCIDRSAIVALSAEPPGVNELCVCVYCYTISVFFFHSLNGLDYKRGKAVPDAPDTPEAARNHPNTYCTFN